MSAAKLVQTTKLENEFSKILKRLGKKGDCTLGDTIKIEEDVETAPILLDDLPVGNVLVRKSPNGQEAYVRRAMIQKDVLNAKAKKVNKQYEPAEPKPQTYERFVNLLYIKGKGRVDSNYKIPL